MKHHLQHIFPRMMLLLAFCYSCQKSNDIYPQVSVLNPLEGKTYKYNDTIRIKAEVTDRNGNLTFNLLNGSDLIPIDGRLTYSQGNYFEYEIYLNNKYLPGGKYDIKVTAYNGENGTSKFVTIYYKELEKALRGVIALSGEGGFSHLTKFDSSGTFTHLSLAEDYRYLAACAGKDFFLVAGPTSPSLLGYRFSTLQNAFTLQSNDIPGSQKYTFLLGSREGVYVFRHDGFIKAYNSSGEVIRSYNLGENYIPVTGAFGDPGLCVIARLKGTPQYDLLILNDHNGSIRKKASIARAVLTVTYTGNNNYTLIYEEDPDLIIANYSYQTNTITEHLTLVNCQGLDLLALNASSALVSTSKGIQLFNPQIPSIPGTVLNFAATDIDLEVVSNQVYYASGNAALAGQGQMVNQIFTAPAEIRQIEMIHNK